MEIIKSHPLSATDDVDMISQCQLFNGIKRPELESLLSCFQIREILGRTDQMMFQAGTQQTSFGIVVEGNVFVQKEDVSGERLILNTFGPADLFGEVSAFSGSGRWLNNVVARTDCRIWMIPAARISSPCSDNCPGHQMLIQNMLSIVSQRAVHMNQRIYYLQMKRMRQKLAAFLFDMYLQSGSLTFMVPFNREAMADYLNVSRPSMSRELGRMKQENMIDFYRQAFAIKDLAALRHSVR